jgi:hypothetical protein
VHGWRLYQYVQRKVEAQTAPELPHPQGEDAQICASSSAPPPLPEAPASANVRVQIAGREVQITLRDTDEARLLVRLQTLLEQFPVPKPPVESTEGFQGRQSPQANGQKGFCALHGVQMKLNDKNGRQWWSHRLPDDQGWCKGGRR